MSAAPKILFAEDDPSMQFLLTHLFQRAGFKVSAAKNGREALELATSECFDLICSDVKMSEVDGLTLCRMVKCGETFCRAPVILLSASALPADMQAGYEAGCDRYMTKPFEVDELISEIHRLLKPSEA